MKSILIVDEDAAVRGAAAAVLGKLGCQVRVVATAREADNRLAQRLPDAILVSSNLREMRDGKLVERWRQQAAMAHRPIVVIAATPCANVSAIRAGARSVIRRPIDEAGIASALPELLRSTARAVNTCGPPCAQPYPARTSQQVQAHWSGRADVEHQVQRVSTQQADATESPGSLTSKMLNLDGSAPTPHVQSLSV